MTRAETIGIVLGSISSVAAIVAAWASVAERLEKRKERQALSITDEEETLLSYAATLSDPRFESGSFEGGYLIEPGIGSKYIKLKNETPLNRLVSFGYLNQIRIMPGKNHGPQIHPGGTNYTNVTLYELTISGRVRAKQISKHHSEHLVTICPPQ